MRIATVLLAVLFLAQAPSAQTEWREHADGASVSYDVLSVQKRASFGALSVFGPSYSYRTSRLFSAHLLSARVPVSSRVTLLAEVPVVYRDYDISAENAAYLDRLMVEDPYFGTELGQTRSQVSVGNPMVGAEVSMSSTVRLDASLRVPSQRSTEGINTYGSYRATDVASRLIEDDRAEAYQTGVTSLTVGVTGRAKLPAGITLTGRIAPVLSVMDRDVLAAVDPTGTQSASYLSARGGAFARGRFGPVSLGLGAVGRLPTPASSDAYDHGGTATAVGQVTLDRLPVRPTLQYRVGLAGYPGQTLSLSLDVPLR